MTAEPAGARTVPDLDLAVTVECADWTAAIAGLEDRVRPAVDAAIAAARADAGGAPRPKAAGELELGLVFADDERVHALNWQYRRKDAPTNVLAFENADAPPAGQPWQLGDVVLAFGACRAEAAAAGIALEAHVIHLVIHGILHLFGYDHLEERDARQMEGLETRVLAALGIADPYANDANSGLGETTPEMER